MERFGGGVMASLLRRMGRALLAKTAWRQVRRTPVWSYWQNTADGRRLAIQSRCGGTEALDRSFMRPGDLIWGRGERRMRFVEAPERPVLPWREWRAQ